VWLAGVYWTIAIEMLFYASVFLWKLVLPATPLDKLAPIILLGVFV